MPPEGVVLDGTGQNHKLQTKYAYNTLGQVVWQQTPDAGESKFWIDYYGRVKLSQNAEQKEHSDYAYSKFDELGRPYEVGKLSSSGNLRLEVEGNNPLTLLEKSELIFDSDFPRAGSVTLLQVNGGTPTFNFTLSERTKTFYDKHDATGIVDPIEQKNLKNRVAAVVVMEAVKTSETQPDELGAITRYSYDIHGNVEKLWQQLPQETGVPEKTVEYNYDLLSGKVNEVIYNRGGDNDEFRHRYLYDGDNRLTQVETSLDGYHWTLEASYFYYAHGPLARIETGEHNLQGTDYFYTLQGWIKGVNSIGLDADRDLGQDGAQQSTFNKDEYAYALNYYDGDYEARGGTDLLGETFYTNEKYSFFTGYQDKVGGVTYNRESLYNGNIAAMATSIRHFGEEQGTQSMNYRYDQLHRIAAAHASKWEGIWTTVEGSYNTSYAYDGNGNIQNLYRNNLEATTIDELYYHYDPVKKNRLDVVKDGGTAEGLNNHQPYEYKYDQIGNLTQNLEDGIEDIEWNIYGKVEKVSKTNGTLISYRYDGTGNRILKEVRTTTTVHTNFYLRDATGTVMAIYEDTRPINSPTTNITLKEIPIYGSSRLGQYRPKTDTKKTALGQRIYEFSNHLGNVLVTLTDNKVPQTDGTYESVVVSASDYYPFGMAMKERTYSNSEYRYGFQGQEQSDELDQNGNSYTAEFWQYNAVIGRRWNIDPIDKPWESSYAAFADNPIWYIDPYGNDWYVSTQDNDADAIWFDNQDDAKAHFGDVGFVSLGAGEMLNPVEISSSFESLNIEVKSKKEYQAALAGTTLIIGGLVADDVTAVGVIDDIAIPVVAIVGYAYAGYLYYDYVSSLESPSVVLPPTSIPITGIDSPFAIPIDYATDDGVKTVADGDGYITLFRGVHKDHPDYPNALRGEAHPKGGHENPVAHNNGDNSSIFTSWSVNPWIAWSFATKQGKENGGLVLIKQVHVSEITPSPDKFFQGEVLLRGIVRGAIPIPVLKLP